MKNKLPIPEPKTSEYLNTNFKISDTSSTTEIVDKLSKEKTLQLLRDGIGYSKKMPDIKTFLTDDYFLGGTYFDKTKKQLKVYDFWVDALEQVFPNNVVSPTFISVSGAIGTGKSTFSQIILAYDYLKYCYISDPGSFLNLMALSGYKFKWFNVFKYKAEEQIEPMITILSHAPCFKELFDEEQYKHKKRKHQQEENAPKVFIMPAATTRDIISEDVPVFVLSEINFLGDAADNLIASCLSRLNSRFQRGFDLLTHFILDSSDVSSNSPTELFTYRSGYSNRVLSFKVPIWKAKPTEYWHKGNFKVYAGDSIVKPHILEDKEDIKEFDPDRIVKVPEELRVDFETNIELALQEKVGIGLMNGGMLFPDPIIKNHFTIPPYTEDVLDLDFYDDTQIKDLPGVLDALNILPNDKSIYIGLDSGLSNDKYGIAIGYADSVSYRDLGNGQKSEEIYVNIPLVFSLTRKKGQETNLTKVKNFIMYLAANKSVGQVAYDTYQTSDLGQQMDLHKIPHKIISVDKTDREYLLFKRQLNESKIRLVNNELLYKEFRCLRHVDGKVDHTNLVSGDKNIRFGEKKTGVNSKDSADAVVRCFCSIYNAGLEAFSAPQSGEAYKNYTIELYKGLQAKRAIRSNYNKIVGFDPNFYKRRI